MASTSGSGKHVLVIQLVLFICKLCSGSGELESSGDDGGSGGLDIVDWSNNGGISLFGFKIGVFTAVGVLLMTVITIFTLSSIIIL